MKRLAGGISGRRGLLRVRAAIRPCEAFDPPAVLASEPTLSAFEANEVRICCRLVVGVLGFVSATIGLDEPCKAHSEGFAGGQIAYPLTLRSVCVRHGMSMRGGEGERTQSPVPYGTVPRTTGGMSGYSRC